MAQILLVKNTPLESLNVPSSLTQRDIYQAVDTAARRTADDFVPAYSQSFQSEGMYASNAAYSFHQALKKRAIRQAENNVMNLKDSFIVGAKAYTYLRPNANYDTAQLLKMIPQARRDAVEKIEIKMSVETLIGELTTLKEFFPSVTSIDLSVKEAKAMNMIYMVANKEISGGAPNPVTISYSAFVDALEAFPKLRAVKMANVTQDAGMDAGLRDKLKADLPEVTFSF